ncbi:alpha/beta fold hydrolase [Streptomyces sp. NPDC015127]|uniref:alpha/beta fold hydrolase n=1 Tax=Streptomyces sp. NPDC015127 TaxID=3364939 RepID=UPI0036FE931B
MLVVIQQLDREGWGPVVDRLSREREVVAVDLPGFGDSPPFPQGTTPTVAALADAVIAWLRAAGLGRPPVAGNSLGGAVAIEMARADAVGSATALSPIGLWTRPEAIYATGSLRLAGMFARAVDHRTQLVAGNPVGRTLAFWQLAARPWAVPEQTARDALHNLARSPGFEATRRAVRTYRLTSFVPKVPVTIAWGTRDLLTPPHQARRAARRLPQAHHVSLKGCGHSPMSDDREAVADLVLTGSG